MVVSLSPEREAELLAEYKAKKAAIAEAIKNQHAEQEKQRLETSLFYQKLQAAKQKPKTARKPHPCEVCGLEIAVGEKLVSRSVTVGYGYPEGLHYTTFYRHEKCRGL